MPSTNTTALPIKCQLMRQLCSSIL